MKHDNRKSTIITVIIAMVVALPSLFWFSKDEVLAHGLFFPWPDWTSSWWLTSRYLYSWVDFALGSINTEPSGFLYAGILTLLTKVSSVLSLGQGGVIFTGYVAIFLSMAFLLKALKQSIFAAILAGAIYLYNPIVFTGLPLEPVNIKLIPFNVATPLIVAVLVKIFNSKNWQRQLAIFTLISFFPGSLGYSSLQYFSIHLIFIAIFCLVKLLETLRTRQATRLVLLKAFSAVFLFFLVNTFWLLPILSSLGSSYTARDEPSIPDLVVIDSLSATVSNSLRMLQYPGQMGASPWMGYYNHPVLIFLSIGIVIVGLSSLFIEKVRRWALYPAIMLVIGLFLSKGTLPIFAGLGRVVFLTSPYITRLFRNPTYFGSIVAFSISVLFGLSLGYFFDYIAKRKNPKVLVAAIVIVILAFITYGWQFIIGSPIGGSSKSPQVQSVKVPRSFAEATEYIRNDKEDFRIITIPMVVNRTNYTTFNWQRKYVGFSPVGIWSSKSMLPPSSQLVDDLTQAVFAPTKEAISKDDWVRYLQNQNVRYVTLHQDSDVPGNDKVKDREKYRSQINEFIRNSPYLEKAMGNDQVEVFRLKSEYFHPHIYAERSKPIVSFQKINPTKYVVRVENSVEPYELIFLESFHPGWKVSIDKRKPLDEDRHIMIYDYANSWTVNPSDSNGRSDYDLTIEYVPQRVTYLGFLISLIVVGVSVIVVIKKHRNE